MSSPKRASQGAIVDWKREGMCEKQQKRRAAALWAGSPGFAVFLGSVGSDEGLLRQLPASDFERQAGGQTQPIWEVKVLALEHVLWPECDYVR